MWIRLLAFLAIVIFSQKTILGNATALSYIEQYKAIAISEMHRSAIPASIKLAQGLLESGSGTSTLAREANNHFGIKCGPSWTGKTYGLKDDDYKNGKLIKSCFRVFEDAYESYIAHSDFLTDPRKEKRYGHLFDLSITDYVGWAYGLKASGYATDIKYPEKLISLIEKYQLYNYDSGANEPLLASSNAPVKDQANKIVAQKSKAPTNVHNVAELLDEEEHPEIIATYGTVAQGQYRWMHNDSVGKVCKTYGITEDEFYAFNRIPHGSLPSNGSIVHIDGYMHWGKQAAHSVASNKDEDDLLFADEAVESFKTY